MGLAATIRFGDPGNVREEYLPIGNNEIRNEWEPIVRAQRLELLEVAIGGGLSVTADLYDQLVREVEGLVAGLGERSPTTSPQPARLLELLKAHPPSKSCEIYVG